jgi:multidrug efflux pump subunit AcrA (membrane-fusion protein)
MRIGHWLIRGMVGLCLIGAVVAVYQTQAYWWPYVFPAPSPPVEEASAGETEPAPADRIKLSPQAQQNLGLRSATLTPRPYWRTLLIPGVVVDRPGESDIGIHARVGGVITDIAIRPGETVRPGQLLFRIELVSEFLQATQIELAKTVKELALAQVERDRIARLVEGGSVAGAELVRQQSQVERLTHLVQSLRRQLQLYGLQPDQIERIEKGAVETTLLLTVPLRSDAPTAQTLYEVKELKVRLGDQVAAGAHLCTLSDHRWLFIEGWAFPSEAKALTEAAEKNWPVTADFVDEEPGDWPPLAPLTIHHLGNQLDPRNRTFPFYLSLPNQARSFERNGKTYLAWRFRPGQRVRLRVPVEKLATYGPDGLTSLDPFVVPVEAVVREGPEAYVFVQAGDLFIRKPVRVLYEDWREAVLANDRSITQAELVVLNQAAALNRALKAAQTGGSDHDHDH